MFFFSGHPHSNKNQDTYNIRSGTIRFTSADNYKCCTDVALNYVRSVRNANLMKGKSYYSNATLFACVNSLFETRFLLLYEISYSSAELDFCETEMSLKYGHHC